MPWNTRDIPWWRADAALPCPARRADLLVEGLGDEALFTDPRTQTTYRLNATAIAIWDRLDPDRTTLDLAGELAETYGVPADRVLEDVEQTLAFFAAHGLLAA